MSETETQGSQYCEDILKLKRGIAINTVRQTGLVQWSSDAIERR